MIWIFKKIKGIVIGHIYQFNNYEQENIKYEDVILDLLKDYDFPILKINEFWHYQPHAFLPIWAKIRLDAKNKEIKIIKNFLI